MQTGGGVLQQRRRLFDFPCSKRHETSADIRARKRGEDRRRNAAPQAAVRALLKARDDDGLAADSAGCDLANVDEQLRAIRVLLVAAAKQGRRLPPGAIVDCRGAPRPRTTRRPPWRRSSPHGRADWNDWSQERGYNLPTHDNSGFPAGG